MESRVQRMMAGMALATILLVSLFGVCKQMLTTCGWDCSAQTMGGMHAEMTMDGCATDSAACVVSVEQHMATFASVYPSVAPSAMSLFVLAGALFAAWFFSSTAVGHIAERLRGKYRYLKQRLFHYIALDFLVVAFSRGILNAKIYASS